MEKNRPKNNSAFDDGILNLSLPNSRFKPSFCQSPPKEKESFSQIIKVKSTGKKKERLVSNSQGPWSETRLFTDSAALMSATKCSMKKVLTANQGDREPQTAA